MKKVIISIFSILIILFIFNSHYVKADTLPKAITHIDSPTSNQSIGEGNPINISGWAVNTAGVNQVQVLVDGKFLIGAQYGVSRPDVNNAIPGYPSGNNAGYISSISAPTTPGNHTITINAIGNDGSNCSSSVNINVLSKAITHIDSPTSNQSIGEGNPINISGWAVNTAGVNQVQVLVDGKFLIGAQYGVSRPDVNNAIPGYPSGNNAGYISSISAPTTPGNHTITINAIGNDGSNCSSSVNINVLSKAITHIDSPTSNQSIIEGNPINISGWAVNTAGVNQVQVLVDGNFLIGAQYGVSRPDVNNAIPGYPSGNNAGYISSISAPTTPGNHTITINAIGNDGSNCSASVNINVESSISVYSMRISGCGGLTTLQEDANAEYIYNYMTAKGWTKNAICGMLGNMEAESGLNPDSWEYLDQTGEGCGFGLVQWTPATNYLNWANLTADEADAMAPEALMDSELNHIQYELINGLQWSATNNAPYYMSFNQFTQSFNSPYNLALTWQASYERPKATQNTRGDNAVKWYNFFN